MNGVGLGSLGATTFYGEYGQYNDFYGLALANRCRQLMLSTAPPSPTAATDGTL